MAIKAQGGVAVVQSEAEFSGTPLSARAHVDVDHVVHAGLLQDVLLHGTTLDREDLTLLDAHRVPG